jgi:cyclophilin family peptidyl-prolyl cis-trans isomerase
MIAVALSAVSLGSCGNFTVTEEAWFEVEVKDLDGSGEDYKGQFTLALFGETAPMTVMNFAALTRGYKKGGLKLAYKNSKIHRIVPDFVIQMGDITVGDGTGGRSIFGERFNDEDFILSHRSAGWVAMANHGPDTNNSQFYILLTKARWLDNKHVVFAKVIRGYDVIEALGEVPSDPNTAVPKKEVRIVDCGVNRLDKPYDLTKDQLESTEDL